MQHTGDTAALCPSFVTAGGMVFDKSKKMETRHEQTSNISILQVNHLHWPQCATAQRGERRERPLKLGVTKADERAFRNYFLSSKQKTGKFGARVEILKSAPLSLFIHLKNIRRTTYTVWRSERVIVVRMSTLKVPTRHH